MSRVSPPREKLSTSPPCFRTLSSPSSSSVVLLWRGQLPGCPTCSHQRYSKHPQQISFRVVPFRWKCCWSQLSGLMLPTRCFILSVLPLGPSLALAPTNPEEELCKRCHHHHNHQCIHCYLCMCCYFLYFGIQSSSPVRKVHGAVSSYCKMMISLLSHIFQWYWYSHAHVSRVQE